MDGKKEQSYTYTRTKATYASARTIDHMSNASHVRNMVNTHRQKTSQSATPNDRAEPIRIQKMTLRDRRNIQTSTLHPRKKQRCANPTNGHVNAFDAVNRTQLRTTLCKNGIPLEKIIHIRSGHQQLTICAKRQGTCGKEKINDE